MLVWVLQFSVDVFEQQSFTSVATHELNIIFLLSSDWISISPTVHVSWSRVSSSLPLIISARSAFNDKQHAAIGQKESHVSLWGVMIISSTGTNFPPFMSWKKFVQPAGWQDKLVRNFEWNKCHYKTTASCCSFFRINQNLSTLF